MCTDSAPSSSRPLSRGDRCRGPHSRHRAVRRPVPGLPSEGLHEAWRQAQEELQTLRRELFCCAARGDAFSAELESLLGTSATAKRAATGASFPVSDAGKFARDFDTAGHGSCGAGDVDPVSASSRTPCSACFRWFAARVTTRPTVHHSPAESPRFAGGWHHCTSGVPCQACGLRRELPNMQHRMICGFLMCLRSSDSCAFAPEVDDSTAQGGWCDARGSVGGAASAGPGDFDAASVPPEEFAQMTTEGSDAPDVVRDAGGTCTARPQGLEAAAKYFPAGGKSRGFHMQSACENADGYAAQSARSPEA